ncbi:OmpA family protein [Archangium primigenium]|uniref:OmpA family protein n=1 Tax=[Archangium] primigenium TaxID=2792470 RepID=UPI00195C15D4|nr:OmpA family protein [Archangium primigenium]MBM7115299.1 OmpA family protein [Archangium primigenium]
MSRSTPGQVMSWLATLLTANVALAGAPAGSPGFALERLALNPGAAGSLLLGTGELLSQGELRLSTVWHYQHKPVLLASGNAHYQIIGNRLTTHLSAAYSPTTWLELSAQLPLVAFQRGQDAVAQGFAAPTPFGVSTPSLGARLGVLSQLRGHAMDLALGLSLGLPLGNASGLPPELGAHVTPQVMVGRRLGWFRLGLEAQALLRKRIDATPDAAIQQAAQGSELRLGAVAATLGQRLRWEVNVVGTSPLVDSAKSMEVLVGGRYLLNTSVELFAVGGVGLGASAGTPLYRVMVGSAFGGVSPTWMKGESSVNCSPGFKHTVDECPELDEDQDGIRNVVDKCPFESGILERGGCPFLDQDGDGIEDSRDGCPTEVGLVAYQGCPMPDGDQDGVADEVDSCPADYGPADNRGCPRRDKDGDGIEDDVDACPLQPGEAKFKGCPEEDRDGDGLANSLDSCPDMAGKTENHGCPDHEIPMVYLERDRFVLLGRVFFAPNQPKLEARSHAQLDWVARVIKEHPEFHHISVGAHSDNRGFAQTNLYMTQAQAQAVQWYLIERGVEPERLEARGYGDTRPIGDNNMVRGREQNRRVEFKIVQPD